MTDEDTVVLGLFCEGLKTQESWQVLLRQFEAQSFQHFMSTKGHETKMRESIYASFNGVVDFIGNMDAIIAQKDEILRREEELSLDALNPQEF